MTDEEWVAVGAGVIVLGVIGVSLLAPHSAPILEPGDDPCGGCTPPMVCEGVIPGTLPNGTIARITYRCVDTLLPAPVPVQP